MTTSSQPQATELNRERAARCLTVLFSYTDFDPRTNLIDLLTDALHWCRLNEEDFGKALDLAREHFLAETTDEQSENRP